MMTLLFEVRSVTVLEGLCTRQFRALGKAASGFQCGFYVSVLISTAYNTASLGTGEAKKKTRVLCSTPFYVMPAGKKG